MLDTLIKALRESGASVDSDSIANTLWLRMAMGAHNAAEKPLAQRPSEPAWQEDVEAPIDTSTSTPALPATVESPPPTSPVVDDIPLVPTAASPVAGQTAALGVLPSLPERAAFKRAVKQLRSQHRQPSQRLDERAMVRSVAEDSLQALKPVFMPGSRRSLRLSLIRERSGTNALWTQPLDELAALFHGQGTFKLQREWSLGEREAGAEAPMAVLSELDRQGQPIGVERSAERIKWWPGEIILIASDFTSNGWWDGTYLKLLRGLAARQPVALLHTLPGRLWSRTWTGTPDASVSSARALVPARALDVRVLHLSNAAVRDDARLAIPLVELAVQPLSAWARLLMGRAGSMAAILLDEREPEVPAADEVQEQTSPPVDAKRLAMQYRMASSPLARLLAQHLSVTAPLSFPVMRWVQQAMLPHSDTSHLAEFVLGGLLKVQPSSADTPADTLTYDFIEGVRPLLQQGMPKVLGLETQLLVGRYLERMHHSTLDMRAVVETWSDEQLHELSSEHQAFAMVSRGFLERIGLRPRGTSSTAQKPGKPTPVHSTEPDPDQGSPAPKPAPPLQSAQNQWTRTLREPVQELQWSPFDEERLAIRTFSGIDLWRPAHETDSRTLRQQKNVASIRKPTLVLYWWVPAGPEDEGGKLEAIKMIVRRLSEALMARLPGRVRIKRLRNPIVLNNRRNPAQALLIFQTSEYSRWAHAQPLQFTAIERFIARKNILSSCVEMGAKRSAHPLIHKTIHLKERDLQASGYLSTSEFWAKLSWLTNTLCKRIQRLLPTENEPITAMTWLSENQIGIASHDGAATTVAALNVGRKSLSGDIDSGLLAFHRSSIPLTHLFVRPALETPRGSRNEQPAAEQLVCMDAQGSTYIKRDREDQNAPLKEVISGEGIPRRPVFSPLDRRWWIAGEEPRLLSPSTARKLHPPEVPLLSICDLRKEDNVHTLLHDQIFAGWTLDDSVFAITAAGFLHQGSIHDMRVSNRTSQPLLDRQPRYLNGILREAAASADGHRFATLTAYGRLDLWDTLSMTRLNSWQVITALAEVRHVRLGLSATGQRIAFSDGRTVRVFEEPLSAISDSRWMRQVLWVDDRPGNNEWERHALASQQVRCTLALSTDEALETLEKRRFAVIISDMGRREGSAEGYVLLKALREAGNLTPYFIYASSDLPEHHDLALQNGAQGSTSKSDKLLRWVMECIDGPSVKA
ncbi:response regulator [Pseudomonas fluorescens]|uniref:response regulator n=1 Tax=Pseudomonas fluorescens TaxID=294 RepID=UPI0002FD7A1D|nr:response regulator [Pseudomonas fluorescens]